MIQYIKSALYQNTFVIKDDSKTIGQATEDTLTLNMSGKEAEIYMTKEKIREIKIAHKKSFPDGKITKVLTTK